jgi:aryl-alcohol dehydrogenase-like predicted oxidoreductase
MQYKNLGRTGLKVSTLCLGTMQFGWTADEKTSKQVLNAAFEAGVNFIDTANIYSQWVEGNPGGVSETIIGNWMVEYKIPRDQLVIATKVRGPRGEGLNNEGLSRVHILREVENSLKRLQVEFIDLYQTHWYDEHTPIEETLSTLDDLVRQGVVRYIGCSNYPAWRLMQALWASERLNHTRYDSLQPHYSLVNRAEFERELADVCRIYGLGVIPYSPLGGGFLTGKYRRDSTDVESARRTSVERRYFNERNWRLLDLMEGIGAETGGCSISQVALAWQLHNPVITSPIIGPRNLAQLEDNLGAVEVKLSENDMDKLNEASEWRS